MFRFSDWPNDQVPRRAAGVYTVWRGDEFIYVGMSGRGAQLEDFVASHASGRRSGDQFNVCICDRFIIPVLTPDQQQEIGHGILQLDQLTKNFIRQYLGYRFVVYPSGEEALTAERDIRTGRWLVGLSYLNPL
jgi:hypothetical protein